MNASHIKYNIDIIAGLGLGFRANASGEVNIIDNQVQEGFGTQTLGNFNICFEVSALMAIQRSGLIMDILGTNTRITSLPM
jgi:hypothetical protein